MYKMWSTEGAIVCPLIIHYPNLFSSSAVSGGGSGDGDGGKILKEFTTVMDILPTILELANVSHQEKLIKVVKLLNQEVNHGLII